MYLCPSFFVEVPHGASAMDVIQYHLDQEIIAYRTNGNMQGALTNGPGM